MKKLHILFFVFNTLFVNAQTTEYFDWNWKPCEPALARFVGITTQTDSGWKHVDYFLSNKKARMVGLYRDSTCKIKNGLFTYYYANGNDSSTGRYINDKREGVWLSYHNNGIMSDSNKYQQGNYTGTSISWHSNGYMADSTAYNGDNTAITASWFDNATLASSGRMNKNKKQGKWQFFHKNGKLAALEEYNNDKLIGKTYFDKNGFQQTDTSNNDRDAAFKGGASKWIKFLENNLEWPNKYKLVNTDIVTVVLKAVIDEEGNIEEVFVDVPFNDIFDQEAVKVMKKSPKWIPARNHNRTVKMYVRQPITFKQTKY